ncbi:MAG TPA: hypothetical protein PK566_07005 [Pseudobacteroides sp.]|nr:hypothetical protein [Pseudobacteroides sp.]
MDRKEAYDLINGMLEDTDYPITIKNIGDVEDFLLDDSNRRFPEQYAAIGRIYDELSAAPHKSAYNADF